MTVKFGCPGKYDNNGSFHFFFQVQGASMDTGWKTRHRATLQFW